MYNLIHLMLTIISLLYNIMHMLSQYLQVVDESGGIYGAYLFFILYLGTIQSFHIIHSFFLGEFNLHFTNKINYPQVTGNNSLIFLNIFNLAAY